VDVEEKPSGSSRAYTYYLKNVEQYKEQRSDLKLQKNFQSTLQFQKKQFSIESRKLQELAERRGSLDKENSREEQNSDRMMECQKEIKDFFISQFNQKRNISQRNHME